MGGGQVADDASPQVDDAHPCGTRQLLQVTHDERLETRRETHVQNTETKRCGTHRGLRAWYIIEAQRRDTYRSSKVWDLSRLKGVARIEVQKYGSN